MKKSSVFVTLFLVVALIFAVSCPDKNPSIKVTTENATQTVSLKDDSKDVTFSLKVALANDTFNDETVKSGESVAAWVKLSDTTKATVKSATVASLNAAKDEAIVTLVVTGTATTAANTPVKVTFAIPAATETSSKVWTTSKKAIAEASANNIAITVVDKEKVVPGTITSVTATTSDASTSKTTSLTITGGTFANTTDISVVKPESASADHVKITFAVNSTTKSQLDITVSLKTGLATTDSGTYKISIPASCITPDETHVASDVSADLTLTIN